MKKRIKKSLTIKGAKIITAIVDAILIILLTVYLILDISKDSVGAVIVIGTMGLACISCISSICYVILEYIVAKHNEHNEN